MPLFADRYDLGPLIGHGGMSDVHTAHDVRLDRPVAVKLLRPEFAVQPLVRDRFESEARLAARLMHPNVVAVFDSGEAEGVPYIVMERLPGETLHDRLARGPMPEPEVRQLAAEILAALETAHAAGILHRDIKPANVLASGDGRWKVTDFGIAKALEVDGGDATATGLVLGTPAYLAPERLFGSPATVASDLYSVAVVLYEALAGRRPFDTGASGGWPGVAAGAPLVPLATVRPEVDPALTGTIERGLAREPSERFWSAAEMGAAIDGRGQASVAGPPPTEVLAAGPATEVLPLGGPAHTELLPPSAGPHTEVLTAAGRPGPPRHPAAKALAAVAGLAILAVIIIAAVASAHGGHGGTPATSRTTAAPTTGPTTASTTATTLPPSTTTSSSSTTSSTSSTSTTSTTSSTTILPITLPGGSAGGGLQGPPGKHRH